MKMYKKISLLYIRKSIEEIDNPNKNVYSLEIYSDTIGEAFHSDSDGDNSSKLLEIAKVASSRSIDLLVDGHQLATIESARVGGTFRNQIFLPVSNQELVEFVQYYNKFKLD